LVLWLAVPAILFPYTTLFRSVRRVLSRGVFMQPRGPIQLFYLSAQGHDLGFEGFNLFGEVQPDATLLFGHLVYLFAQIKDGTPGFIIGKCKGRATAGQKTEKPAQDSRAQDRW